MPFHPPSQTSSPTSTPPPPCSTANAQISPPLSRKYWSTIPTTVTGMLGGHPQISRVDLRGSYLFFRKLQKLHPYTPPPPPRPRSDPDGNRDDEARSSDVSASDGLMTGADQMIDGAKAAESEAGLLGRGLDVGAGIGRVTSGLLSRLCAVTDIVEAEARFAAQAPLQKMVGSGRLGEVFVSGLETWMPDEREGRKYDLVWVQWCLGYLNDGDLADFLRRVAGRGREEGGCLKEGGWIVVKENISTTKEEGKGNGGREMVDVYDKLDSSVTRSDATFRRCFRKAGLRVVSSELQRGFEKGLLPVRFYALRVEIEKG